MKRTASKLILALVLTATWLPAAESAGHFIPAGTIDVKTILPPPPVPGSVAAMADFETVIQVQSARTPADVAWAKQVEKDSAFSCESVLGSWFTKENLPLTEKFLKQVTDDANAASAEVKVLYSRLRPPLAGLGIEPCVEVPKSGSYPSGHSMRAYFWAAVLGDIFPDQQATLSARAHRVAWGRVIGGVHFPSDTIGGRMLAEAIIEVLRKSPEYRATVEKCRAEAAPFLLKKAA